jgi:hypothetical protein
MPFLFDARLVTLSVALATCAACAPHQSSDQLKEKTAETTATLKRDTKAIAEGVKEGLSRKESVNLNKASKADLQSCLESPRKRRTESSPSGLTSIPANW